MEPAWNVDLYLDDSDTFARDYVCLAGYAAMTPTWRVFCDDWLEVGRKYGIPKGYLHTTKLLAGQKPYKGLNLTSQQRVDLLVDYLRVIHRRAKFGVVIVADKKALASVLSHHKQPRMNAQVFCLGQVVQSVLLHHHLFERCIGVNLMCDLSDAAPHFLASFRNAKQQIPQVRAPLGAIGFGDDQIYQPLQAADLLAWLSTQGSNRGPFVGSNATYKDADALITESLRDGDTHYVWERWDRDRFEAHGPGLNPNRKKD